MSDETQLPAAAFDAQQPGQEPLTPEEKERFLARVRGEGRALTAEERLLIFEPAPVAAPAPAASYDAAPMQAAHLDRSQLARLEQDFFDGLGIHAAAPRLVQGVIFDFDHTLANLSQPLEELMLTGAQAAEAYMRGAGMELPPDFAANIVEARRFAEEKSAEEAEEHLADDALSFLLQFFGYPASRMDPAVLQRAVDIFYAPEMTAWRLRPGALDLLQTLHSQGYRLALLANYNCDRVFQRTVDYLGIRRFFDVCLCSASVEYRKPDARYFELVLDRWDALPYEVVVVGDSLVHDIQGGIELGSQTIWVNIDTSAQVQHDNTAVAAQVRPDATVTDLADVAQWVAAWAA
jgi:HAD superfamily hydrolase (TIGR01509 family)